MPRKAAATRGGGGAMAGDTAKLHRGQVPRGTGRGGRGLAWSGFASSAAGVVAGAEGGGGPAGFLQEQGEGRRAAPQRERLPAPAGDRVEDPAGGAGHQNVRHRPAGSLPSCGVALVGGSGSATALALLLAVPCRAEKAHSALSGRQHYPASAGAGMVRSMDGPSSPRICALPALMIFVGNVVSYFWKKLVSPLRLMSSLQTTAT